VPQRFKAGNFDPAQSNCPDPGNLQLNSENHPWFRIGL
jgi:hypothetical protein